MEKMKAARLFGIGDFRLDEVEIPQPEGKEILVKVGACGVCGSDLPRIYEHGSSNGKYPITIGHEFSGTIVKTGNKADPALLGKRGAFFPLIPCRECDSCLSGNYAMCSHYDYMGSRRDGGFARYILVPSDWHFVESRNSNVSFESLAMTEPACVAQHSIRKAQVTAGSNVLIYGAGPIGIMAARWAVIFGARKVVTVDVVDSKVEFSRQHGFDCLNSRSEDFEQAVRDAFGGQLADCAVEGTGFGSALENAINTVKPFGKITLLGNPAGDTRISLKAHSTILRKELDIRGMWNSHFSNTPMNEWRYTVDMMDSGKFTCEDLISHRLKLEEVPEFIDRMHSKKIINYCKVLFSASASASAIG